MKPNQKYIVEFRGYSETVDLPNILREYGFTDNEFYVDKITRGQTLKSNFIDVFKTFIKMLESTGIKTVSIDDLKALIRGYK